MKKLLLLICLLPVLATAQNLTVNKSASVTRTLLSGTIIDTVMASYGAPANLDYARYNSTLKKWQPRTPAQVLSDIGAGSGTVTSVSGTTNRITSTGGTTPVIDISATFEALLGKVANPLSQFASTTSSQLAGVISDETGSGALVFGTSPTLTTPNLGTPSTLVGTNITGTAAGLTAGTVTTNANLTGVVTSTGNATSLGSFSSANLSGALTNETGSGLAVFGTSPTFINATVAGTVIEAFTVGTTHANTINIPIQYNTSTVAGYIGTRNGLMTGGGTGFGVRSNGDMAFSTNGGDIAMIISTGQVINIPNLTASQLVATDGSKNLVSVTALPSGTTATTQSAGDNSTKVATTAYVDALGALKANIASPTFTGVPAGPTAAPGTNTTQLATTAFVLANGGSFVNPVFTGTDATLDGTNSAVIHIDRATTSDQSQLAFDTNGSNNWVIANGNSLGGDDNDLNIGRNGIGIALGFDQTTLAATFGGNISAPNLVSGTYTPTLTNGANVSSSTASITHYSRVGNEVSMSGDLSVSATAGAGTNTVISLSLPAGSTSNFASPNNVKGVCNILYTVGNSTVATTMIADTTNDLIQISFGALAAASHGVSFSLHYTVL